jgi:hypothetical protein
MKAIYFLILTPLLFIACNSKQEKMLCRRWRVADVIFLEDQARLSQADSLQLTTLMKQRAILKDVLTKNLYEFHRDGSYITGNAAASSTGAWSFRGNSIMFRSNSSGDVKSSNKTIPFEHLSNDSLVLVLNNDQTTVKMKLVLLPVE